MTGSAFPMKEGICLEKYESRKTAVQFLKFSLISSSVTVVQLVLVNVLFHLMKGWQTPLPGFLRTVFTEEALGKGNCVWGYVMPFLLSNAAANIYGYFINSKTTFHARASAKSFRIYCGVMVVLILFSTWLQGVIVHALSGTPLTAAAPTIAGMCAGTLQFLIIFPLEKYVLLKEE